MFGTLTRDYERRVRETSATTPPTAAPLATISDLLTWRAAHDTDRVLLVVDGRPVTFGDLDHLATQVAAGLGTWEIRPGDRVAVAAPNGLAWLGFFFGAVADPDWRP